ANQPAGAPTGAAVTSSRSDRAAIRTPGLDPQRLRERLAAVQTLAAADQSAVRVVRAPGRVNLIGEHTDYNEGFVLPAAVNLEVRIAFVPTDDRRIVLTSEATGETLGFDLDAIGERTGSWIDYVAGTAWALAGAGIATRGLRGLLASSLPRGAGLSSSAALELTAAWALTGDGGGGIDGMARARLCQQAENRFVGVRCGLMDQFASSLGTADAAMLLDCRTLEHRAVPLPLDRLALVVCHTGSTRALTTSQYNVRRAQCEAATAALAADDPSVRALRDVTPEMLPVLRARVDEETYRRGEHVVFENLRVEATIEALAAGDLATVGRLFAQSHDSLRDLYGVSSPELDALVEIAAGTPGVVAARMTGAGFGGCTVNLVERGAVERLSERVKAWYPARTGMNPRVYAVEAVEGAGFVDG
ncbi:MAG: galactokinase, partial [Chloroflexi bacterium]|nr:galactokinase [Chloroflexota bacterium]